MKTIGLIGGMSWESSIKYYEIINVATRAALGGLHSAKSVVFSVDFAEIEKFQCENRWDKATEILVEAAQSLERAGADFIIICTNTMHKLYDAIQSEIRIPILHIADPTADKIKSMGINKVALLGTRFTMEEDFYKRRLIGNHGLDVLVPSSGDMESVHRIIYDELCTGVINPESRSIYAKIVERAVADGAHGIILGCTEIGLLLRPEDSPVPLFDTTKLHAEAAVKYSISG